MSIIRFEAKLFKIGPWTILRLPKDASAKLPSRGMTMVKGRINGSPFQVALEPDGKGSHWFRIDTILPRAKPGEEVHLEIESTKEWPEPTIPTDFKNALATAPQEVQKLWREITPMARWDWIRWIGSTKNPDTLKKHFVVAISKMRKGERRPCCFNRSMCTDPSVSKNGVLIEPM